MRFLKNLLIGRWRTSLVQHRVIEKVFRRLGQISGNLFNEFLSIGELKTIVVCVLVSDCTEMTSRDRFTTVRTCPMSWIKSHSSFQFSYLLNRVVKHSCKISTSYVAAASQVRPSNLSQEHSISSEKSNVFISRVNQMVARTLKSMARSVPNF